MEPTASNFGQFFIISFPEAAPSDETLYFIQDRRIGGIILFADHCRDQDSLRSWLKDLKKSLNYKLIVAVDQEGGRVRRFRSGFPMLESPQFYARHNKIDQYGTDLSRVCERLFEVGVNLNLAPAVDLSDSEEGHVLDSRTFGDTPEVVGEFARVTIDIHHHQGLLCCAKHFPGLGRSKGDPHQVLSVSDLTEKQFFEYELLAFKDSINYGVDSVMVTHLSVPQVDDRPAIVSPVMIKGWLKDRMEFTGSVITDDLLMEGAVKAAATNVAVDSFAAGSDLLLFGQDLKRMQEIFDRFGEQWSSGRFDKKRIEDAVQRVNKFRSKIEYP